MNLLFMNWMPLLFHGRNLDRYRHHIDKLFEDITYKVKLDLSDLRSRENMRENPEPFIPLPRYVVAVFSVLVAGIIAVGIIYYVHQIHAIKKEKQDELKAIADLKSGQLMRWRLERMIDVEMLSGNPMVRTGLVRWLNGDDSPALQIDIRGCLDSALRSRQYCRVSIFNPDFSRRMSLPEYMEPISPEVSRIVTTRQSKCDPVFLDFYRVMKNGPIRLGILIPVPGCGQPEKTTMGYMLLEIDPTAFLFPLIQSWPTPSHTAETLLVRREGNDVLFLNELRHIKKTVLRLRLPLYRHDLPAARAVLGYEGAMEGDDYRGKAVLAYLDKIPDSPWFMVSKVDQDEIYAPIQKVALSITVIVILMILGSGSFIFVWYRGRQAEIYRRQLELERERTALAERVNLLTRHANDIIFMLDQDWLILEANDRALEAYGYSLEELRHKHLYELRLPGPREEFEPQIEPIKSKGSAVFETTHQRKDGTVFPVESSVRMVEIGGMEFIMDIVRDITERKKAEEEVKKVLADLERSNKELEQFAYVASHDLQEPLRMVSSFTQLLARRYGDKLDQDAKDFINYAVNGANRMQRLIQDLLTYSRVSTRGGSPAPTDTGSALDEVLANLHVSIMESGALVTNDEMPVVTADRSQLVQVFQNLVGNAIKFRSDDPPRIHISAEKSGDEWIFSVEDNGIGMEPQYFDRVFALFQRLHAGEKYQGTGIGLALCKRVIQRLGGRIWVESRHGEGSTFYFTLKGVEQ